jgi:hypothetical protein
LGNGIQYFTQGRQAPLTQGYTPSSQSVFYTVKYDARANVPIDALYQFTEEFFYFSFAESF